MSQHSAAPRRSRGLVRPGLLLVATGALALTLAACGGATTPPAAATSTNAAAPKAPTPPPGAFGTAAAVATTSLEVQNPQSGQVTVDFNSSTTFTNTVSATLADVKVGSCVAVIASSGNMQTMTARTVTITQPTASGCTAAGGFGGGAFRGGGTGGASRSPSASRRPRPSGTNNPNAGRIAFGTVSAVESGGFTVKDIARGSQPAQTTVVQTTSSTTLTQTQSATSAVLAVGDCIAALGPSDDTGAITAKSISVSKPGPGGCTTGFGGGRNFRGTAGGSEGGSTGGGNG